MKISTRQMRCLIFAAILIPALCAPAKAEQITGNACYRYSENESINAARDIALTMAKRDALEGYTVFVGTTSTVENFTLKNDLITSLTAGFLNNLKVTKATENLSTREVCRAISAEVEAIEIKKQVTAIINAYQTRISETPSILPKNEHHRILKTEKVSCSKWPDRSTFTGDPKDCLRVTFECKIRAINYYNYNLKPIRMTWIDTQGNADSSFSGDYSDCKNAGDIANQIFPYPPIGFTFTLEVLRWERKGY